MLHLVELVLLELLRLLVEGDSEIDGRHQSKISGVVYFHTEEDEQEEEEEEEEEEEMRADGGTPQEEGEEEEEEGWG